jgi:hypothetical protein
MPNHPYENYTQAVAISTAYVLKNYFPMTKIIYGGLAATDELARGDGGDAGKLT